MENNLYNIVARYRGHTLIELMVVLAIVAILASVAIPVFQGYGERGRIDELKANMLKVSSIQENHFASRGRYAASMAELDVFEIVDSPEGLQFRTGFIMREDTGMGYWISGIRDVTGTETTPFECWVFFSANLTPGTDDNFVRYYHQSGAAETHSQCTPNYCPTYAIACQ